MTRLCCGKKHSGPVCPDGKVMCVLCFERVEQDILNTTSSGQKEDVCKVCAQDELGLSMLITEIKRVGTALTFHSDSLWEEYLGIKQAQAIIEDDCREYLAQAWLDLRVMREQADFDSLTEQEKASFDMHEAEDDCPF